MELGFTTMNTPEDAGTRPSSPARSRSAGSRRSGSASTPTSRPSRHTPYPAGGELPAAVPADDGPVPQPARWPPTPPRTLRVGTGRGPPARARPVRARQVGGHPRSPLRRPVRLRGGRGLERRGARRPPARHPVVERATRRWRSASPPCKALWRDDEAEHHGRWFDFDAVWSEPKPLQAPHPPIVGGHGRSARHRRTPSRGPTQWMPMDLALGNVAKRVDAVPRRRWPRPAVPPMPDRPDDVGRPDAASCSRATRELGIERVVLGAGREGWDDPTTRAAVPRPLRRARARARRLTAQTTAPRLRAARRSARRCDRARRGSRRCARRGPGTDSGTGVSALAKRTGWRGWRSGAGLRVLPGDEGAVVDDLLVLEHLLGLEDAGHRDPRLDQARRPARRRVRCSNSPTRIAPRVAKLSSAIRPWMSLKRGSSQSSGWPSTR